MSETRTLLAETCERLFADLVTPELIRSAEAGEWPAELWTACEQNGLTRALVPEEQGGAGLGWQDASAILFAAGYHAVPVPLAETLVAGWLLAQAGIDVPEGPISLADNELALTFTDSEGSSRVSGELERVPWGESAPYVLAVVRQKRNKHFVLLDNANLSADSDRNIARDPYASFPLIDVTPATTVEVPGGLLAEPIRAFGALARSVQMAGATAAVLDLCVEYAGDRVQFGRPLSKFQAIQHQLANLAAEAAAARTAAQFACRGADVRKIQSYAIQEIAPAKIRTGEAAGKVAAIGHQVHGAIGFTDEHRLHYLTRRLWAWRSEFGAEKYWCQVLGSMIGGLGAGDLWSFVISMPVGE